MAISWSVTIPHRGDYLSHVFVFITFWDSLICFNIMFLVCWSVKVMYWKIWYREVWHVHIKEDYINFDVGRGTLPKELKEYIFSLLQLFCDFRIMLRVYFLFIGIFVTVGGKKHKQEAKVIFFYYFCFQIASLMKSILALRICKIYWWASS